MKSLKIPLGTTGTMKTDRDRPPQEDVTVSEGWAYMYLSIPLGNLGSKTTLSGRLTVGDKRVYGRFTQATYKGRTYPVCIELYAHGGGLGQERLDDGGGTTAKVHNSGVGYTVERFE
jgi:serine/threonine-protein kinase